MTIKNGRVVMLLPRRLRSLNRRGGFWSEYGDRQAWKKLLTEAGYADDGSFPRPVTARVRVEFVRLAPNLRYLLDKENLESSGKRLTDTLVELGFLVDDRREWADGPWVTQDVSDDKCYWTIVILSKAQPYVQANEFKKVSAQEEARRRLEVDDTPQLRSAHDKQTSRRRGSARPLAFCSGPRGRGLPAASACQGYLLGRARSGHWRKRNTRGNRRIGKRSTDR